MKRTMYVSLLLALVAGINTYVHGQDWAPTDKSNYASAKLVKESKLVFGLLDDQDDLNKALKSAIKKYWTFCEYEYASYEEAAEYSTKVGYSVFTMFSLKLDDNVVAYNYTLVTETTAGKKPYRIEVVSAVLPSIKDKDRKVSLLDFDYLYPYIIKKMNDYLEQNYKSEGNRSKVNRDDKRSHAVVWFYKGGSARLKTSRIFINKDAVNNKKAIKYVVKILKEKKTQIEFVSQDDIIKAMTDKEENVAIIYSDSNGGFEIFSASDLTPIAYGSMFARL